MRQVEPEVYLVSAPTVDWGNLINYLLVVDGREWETRMAEGAATEAEALIEFGGRLCYRSWKPELNPNVKKVRENSEKYLGNVLDSGHGSVLEHAYFSFVFHNVSRVFCYDDETEVLTTEGWMKWPKVIGTEFFGTLNQETGVLEYQQATGHFSFDYSGPMYQVQSEQVDLLVTPNHRMWVQPVDTQAYRRNEQPYVITPAQDILGRRVRYQKCAKWEGVDPGDVVIPASRREWVRRDNGASATREYPAGRFPVRPFARFLGYWMSEGSLNRHHICLAQNRGPVLDRMAAAIREMGLHPYFIPEPHQGGVRTCHTALRDWLGGSPSWEKRVPEMVGTWTPELIREFLEAYIEGDGSSRPDQGHRVIYTASPGMADDLQVLAIKAGWSANVRVDDRTGLQRIMASGQLITNRRPCYIVSILTQRKRPTVNRRRGQHDGMVKYDGRVHCVTVPNGLLFVRRNGKPVVSHNTHELVRHRPGAAYSQESMRFVRLTDIPFWLPPWTHGDQELISRCARVIQMLEEHQAWMSEHFGLDDEGVPFSEKKAKTSFMRRFAPDGVATGIMATFNVRALRHIIYMRTALSAEEEIRFVFDKVARICQDEFPMLMQDFDRTDDGEWIPRHIKV